MRTITGLALVLSIAVSALADDAPWRYRRLIKGAEVHVVLRSGGECDGKVVERREPLVTIRVTKDKPACGNKETLTLDTRKISAADPGIAEPSAKREVGTAVASAGGAAAGTAGTYAAASALGQAGHPALAAGMGMAGLIAIPFLIHAATWRSERARERVVLYVDEVQ
jgi:hypothetical protein